MNTPDTRRATGAGGDTTAPAPNFNVRLTDGQRNRLRDIVGDKMDGLFKKLQAAVANKQDGRADGVRESLRFWTAVDIALRDARETASKPAETIEEVIARDFRHMPMATHLDLKKAYEMGKRAAGGAW